MTGPEPERPAATATDSAAAVASQAPVSGAPVPEAPVCGLSTSSTTAKSAASALSNICTRTVAAFGLSVKLTCRSACQGTEAISTEASPMATQGCGPDDHPPRANTATMTNGTTEARILQTQHDTPPTRPRPAKRRAYGWRSVNKTRYRRVDVSMRDSETIRYSSSGSGTSRFEFQTAALSANIASRSRRAMRPRFA